jgi:hypothetical protein
VKKADGQEGKTRGREKTIAGDEKDEKDERRTRTRKQLTRHSSQMTEICTATAIITRLIRAAELGEAQSSGPVRVNSGGAALSGATPIDTNVFTY